MVGEVAPVALLAPVDPSHSKTLGPRSARDWSVDVVAFAISVVLGALILSITVQARIAERTRIAREMHDVLAHRISPVALHAGALEVTPDLSPDKVRDSAALLRSTAHQALEELREVIGVLRTGPGQEPTAPQPTLADIPRLIDDTRRAGTRVDFEMQVEAVAAAPGGLGCDAYRIVQEALNAEVQSIIRRAGNTHAGVGAAGMLADVGRNPLAVGVHTGTVLPGSGTGLLGLQERVSLAGGVLVHGPDTSGDFVVEADFPW